MKNVLILAGLVLAGITFHANAATLSWGSVTRAGAEHAQIDSQTLHGSVIGLKRGELVEDTWKFNLSGGKTSPVDINVSALPAKNPTWLTTVLLNGNPLDQLAPGIGVWSFSGILNPGINTLFFKGIPHIRSGSGYQVDAEIPDAIPNPVPAPAAVWLFGSGILGLMGMRNRKYMS